MGTNYYARILPKRAKREELKKSIDKNDFEKVRKLSSELYESFRPYNNEEVPTGEIHLGKRSGGWKFLWNPNIYQIRNGHLEYTNEEHTSSRFVKDPDTSYYIYPLTKEGIKTFIDREDVEIWNEYDEKEDKEEFWKMALNWTTWRGEEAWDSDSYEKEHPEERKWSCKNDYTDFLESLGYTLSKYKSDFYSDGLRFATSTEFC